MGKWMKTPKSSCSSVKSIRSQRSRQVERAKCSSLYFLFLFSLFMIDLIRRYVDTSIRRRSIYIEHSMHSYSHIYFNPILYSNWYGRTCWPTVSWNHILNYSLYLSETIIECTCTAIQIQKEGSLISSYEREYEMVHSYWFICQRRKNEETFHRGEERGGKNLLSVYIYVPWKEYIVIWRIHIWLCMYIYKSHTCHIEERGGCCFCCLC